MMKAARRCIEGEVVAAVVRRLIMLPSDDVATEMAQQQRPDPAMRDDGNVAAVARRSGKHLLNSTNDPPLGVGCALPASDAFFRMSKEQQGRARARTIRSRPRGDKGHSGTGTDGSISTSGCVMK